MRPLRFQLCFLMLLCCGSVMAQQPPMRHFTVDDGLSSNTVYDIEQDSRGFIWFGTSAGITRFDGHSFVRYAIENGLSDNDVIRVKKDLKDRIWLLGFNASISMIRNDSVINGNTHPLLKRLNTGFFISDFYEESPGVVVMSNRRNFNVRVDFPDSMDLLDPWSEYIFKTSNGYVDRIQSEQFEIGSPRPLTITTGKLNPIRKWCYYKDSLVFILLNEGIVSLDKKGNAVLLSIPAADLTNCLEIYCDKNLNIWVINYNTGVRQYAPGPDGYVFARSWFSNQNITSVFHDAEGNFWFSTHGNGVFLMPRNVVHVKAYTKEDGLQDNEAYSILHDRKGRIWMGYKNGRIDVINADGIAGIKLGGDTSSMSRILKIIEVPGDRYLAATDMGAFLIIDRNGKFEYRRFVFSFYNRGMVVTNFTAVKDIDVTYDGSVIVLSIEGVHRLASAELDGQPVRLHPYQLPLTRYHTLTTDTADSFWYGDAGGLKYFFQGQVTDMSHLHPLLHNRISDMYVLRDRLLVSVEGHGLIIIDNKSRVTLLTTEQGLPSNHTGRLFVRNGTAYVCTNKGICMLDILSPDVRVIRNITTADGLLSNQVNDVYADSSGIYAASQRGISVISYKALQAPRKNIIPKIYLVEATWQGNSILNLHNPSLSAQPGNIRFRFISPYFALPEGVKYEYRLNSESWLAANSNTVEFNSLQPGDYAFQVRALFPESGWSEVASYSFIVPQPFYTAWWFYLALLMLIVTAVTLIYRRNSIRLKKEQQVKLEFEQEINRLQGQSLQAMMNPHFIFNSLNAIQQQVRAGHNESAGTYLSRFSKLLRMNLETISEELIPLRDELERIRLYLETEKMRLGEKMIYAITVDEEVDADDVLIPSMIIQPFLENAIWHGIMPAEHQGIVTLSIEQPDDVLEIRIEDNGAGIEQQPTSSGTSERHAHFGIRLTRQRLLFLQKKLNREVSLTVTDKKSAGGEGTLVLIRIPLMYRH